MKRALRTANAVARDKRIPRWVRLLILVGALPIPGPVDEVALIVGVVVLVVLHRPLVVEHWSIQGMSALRPLDTWGAWA